MLNLSVTNQDGVIYHLIHDIPEDDFNVKESGQIEIVGWLYQYYISQKHEEVVDILDKGTVKKKMSLLQLSFLQRIGLFDTW